MQGVVFCWAYYCYLFTWMQYICLQTNKSKQTYVGIESRFEAQNICFGPKQLVSWKYSYNKCALAIIIFFISHETFHLGAAAVKQIRGCVAILILFVVYYSLKIVIEHMQEIPDAL